MRSVAESLEFQGFWSARENYHKVSARSESALLGTGLVQDREHEGHHQARSTNAAPSPTHVDRPLRRLTSTDPPATSAAHIHMM